MTIYGIETSDLYTLYYPTRHEAEAADPRCIDRPEWDGTLTSTWERGGFIDADEAARIREKCRQRHEETDYDELLSRGIPKDDARAICDYQ